MSKGARNRARRRAEPPVELLDTVDLHTPSPEPSPDAMTRERYEELVREVLADTDVDADAYLRGELGDADSLIAEAMSGRDGVDRGVLALRMPAPVEDTDRYWTGDAPPEQLFADLAADLQGREEWEEAVLARYREMFAEREAAHAAAKARLEEQTNPGPRTLLAALLERGERLAAEMTMNGDVVTESTQQGTESTEQTQGESTTLRPDTATVEQQDMGDRFVQRIHDGQTFEVGTPIDLPTGDLR